MSLEKEKAINKSFKGSLGHIACTFETIPNFNSSVTHSTRSIKLESCTEQRMVKKNEVISDGPWRLSEY